MSQHTINITGVPTGSTGMVPTLPPPRLPIFDVVNDPKAFSLLVQALALMQKTDQNQAASHFQIGGIHGKPYVEWDGSGGPKPVSKDWEGYCTHGTVLFPIWHRPYVTLYEQVLQAFVVQIASTYTTPDKLEWVNTAAEFRLPYWDWANKSVPPPQVISQPTVNITISDGTTKTVNNPLYRYEFHPVSDGDFDSPWNQWSATLRCPTDDTPEAETDVKQLISNLTGPNGTVAWQLKHATYVMLSQTKQWVNMSNHSRDINPAYASSLESIHDHVHNYVGGDNGGHMSDPTVAGHDPIFFFHHANVDRLTALWQAIHYTSYVPQSTAEDGTYVYAAGSRIGETTPLAPFWKDASSYWNGDGCRDWAALGYTYPEFVGQDLSDKAQLSASILSKVNTLYGEKFLPSRPRIPANNSAAVPKPAQVVASAPKAAEDVTASLAAAEAKPAEVLPQGPGIEIPPSTNPGGPEQPAQPPTNPGGPEQPPTGMPHLGPGPIILPPHHPEHEMVDWRVRVISEKFALGGSYSILFFLGAVPEQVSEWRTASSFVGSTEVFANIAPGQCANCRSRPDIEVEGTVFLNHALMRSPLESYDAETVTPYLKENLHWRVLRKGQEIDIANQLPLLKVAIVEVPLVMAPEDHAPHRSGDVTHHPSVTTGRPGGANELA